MKTRSNNKKEKEEQIQRNFINTTSQKRQRFSEFSNSDFDFQQNFNSCRITSSDFLDGRNQIQNTFSSNLINPLKLNFDENETVRSSIDTQETEQIFLIQKYQEKIENLKQADLNMNYMKKLYTKYQDYKLPINLTVPQEFTAIKRASLIDWLFQYAVALRLKRSTLHNTIYILDKYLNIKQNIMNNQKFRLNMSLIFQQNQRCRNNYMNQCENYCLSDCHTENITKENLIQEFTFEKIQIISIIILFMVSKVEEIEPIRSSKVLKILEYKIEIDEMNSIETEVLNTLEWKVNPVTSNDFLISLTQFWDDFLLSQQFSVVGKYLNDAETFFKKISPNSVQLYFQLCIILDTCLFTKNHYQYDSLHLSLASMYAIISIYIRLYNVNTFKDIRFQSQLAFNDFDNFFSLFIEQYVPNCNLNQIFKTIQFISLFIDENLSLQNGFLNEEGTVTHEDLLQQQIRHQNTVKSVLKLIQNYSWNSF